MYLAAVVVVLSVRGAEHGEWAKVEQFMCSPSAIGVHAAIVGSEAHMAIASMPHLCVPMGSFLYYVL